jgi:hypothetical protein
MAKWADGNRFKIRVMRFSVLGNKPACSLKGTKFTVHLSEQWSV